jgi:choline dehydrogenase-like flavoprotein
VQHPLTVLIFGVGIAGPTLAYWLARRGHRPLLVERTPELRVGGHAVDIRGTALEVVERMGLGSAVREARTQILTLSAVRPDGWRTYDVALRPIHEARGDREIEIMFLAGVEYQLAALDDEPDGRHQGPAVGCQIAQHPGASAFGQKRDDVIGEVVHPTTVRTIESSSVDDSD